MKTSELHIELNERYKMLRVGQAMYVECCAEKHGYISSARIVGVGREWIRLAGGRRCRASDVIQWWMG